VTWIQSVIKKAPVADRGFLTNLTLIFTLLHKLVFLALLSIRQRIKPEYMTLMA